MTHASRVLENLILVPIQSYIRNKKLFRLKLKKVSKINKHVFLWKVLIFVDMIYLVRNSSSFDYHDSCLIVHWINVLIIFRIWNELNECLDLTCVIRSLWLKNK